MYDKCYFCLDQLPKLKKESTASFFVNFGRSRGTKEPTYITVPFSHLAAIQPSPLVAPQLTPGGGRWVHVPAADCEASQKAFMDRYK